MAEKLGRDLCHDNSSPQLRVRRESPGRAILPKQPGEVKVKSDAARASILRMLPNTIQQRTRRGGMQDTRFRAAMKLGMMEQQTACLTRSTPGSTRHPQVRKLGEPEEPRAGPTSVLCQLHCWQELHQQAEQWYKPILISSHPIRNRTSDPSHCGHQCEHGLSAASRISTSIPARRT